MFIAVFIATIVVLLAIGFIANASKEKALKAAPHNSTRVEVLKANHVRNTVNQYAQAGWSIVQQSSAKSFGSKARVTITFRKA